MILCDSSKKKIQQIEIKSLILSLVAADSLTGGWSCRYRIKCIE